MLIDEETRRNCSHAQCSGDHRAIALLRLDPYQFNSDRNEVEEEAVSVQARKRSIDQMIAAVERARARFLRLADQAEARGRIPETGPAVVRSLATLSRAINRLIPFIADDDNDTRVRAILTIQKTGCLGQERMIVTMLTTGDATLRIMLLKGLAAIFDGSHLGVLTAFCEITGEYDDPAHREALEEAWPMLIMNLGEYRRLRLEAEQAAKCRPRSGAVRAKHDPAANQVAELVRDGARECDQTEW
jgi:hypothetical protein